MGLQQGVDRAANRNPQENSASTPKVKLKIDPALQKDLDKMEKLLPKKLDELGSKQDAALKFVKEKYDAMLAKRKPDIKQQMDLLQKKIASDGGFNPTKYRGRMEEFQKRTKEEGVGILPEPLENVRDLLKKAEADLAPESTARKALLALDKKSIDVTLPALTRENYSKVLEAIHKVENPAKKAN